MSDFAEAIARFFEESPSSGVVSVHLFGSYAEERAHRESDVDVAVLFDRCVYPTARGRFDERVRLTASLGHHLRHDAIDLLALNDVPPPLAARIVTTGRRVFCADAEAAHAFVRDSQLRAADLAPFLRRTRRIKLASLAR